MARIDTCPEAKEAKEAEKDVLFPINGGAEATRNLWPLSRAKVWRFLINPL